jgi:hypothetical protein
MPGVEKVHGQVLPDSMSGGYRTTFLKIGNAQRDFSTSTLVGGVLVEGGFDKAIKAIQKVATTVYIGPNEDRGIIVGVDGITAQPTGLAYNSDSSPTVAERIKAEVDTALSTTTTTVSEVEFTFSLV